MSEPNTSVKQALFDKVYTHLMLQKAKSISGETGKCMYRGDHGLMCAVGCLIKDEHYDCTLENKFAASFLVIDAIEKSLGFTLTEEERDLLQELQSIHDSWEVSSWPDKLRSVASYYTLTVPKITIWRKIWATLTQPFTRQIW